MILWYVGATVAIVRYAFRDERMDLRFLVLGAVLADVLDKPVGLTFYDDLHSVRLVGHSLLLAFVLMTVVVFATRRGRPRRRWMGLPIGVLVHLLLAGMWSSPETLWWPFLGWDFTPSAAATAAAYVGDVLRDPWVWVREAVGAAYLGSLWRRGGLAEAGARREFWRTGQIAAPIERR